MSAASHVSEVFRQVLATPTRGVVGLVDDLLTLCQQHDLQVEWQGERCHIRSRRDDWEEWISVPLRKSVFRSILARIAALCNERTPNAVSPYGGQCELLASGKSAALFKHTFPNTPAEQRVELTPHPPAA